MTLINDVIALAEERDQSRLLADQALTLLGRMSIAPYAKNLPPDQKLQLEQTLEAMKISHSTALQRAKWYQARIDVLQEQAAKRGPVVLAASNELQ